MLTKKKYLVEVRLKNWKPDLKSGGRVFDYLEVESYSELDARYDAGRQFDHMVKYQPSIRKRMENEGIDLSDLCYPDSVEI